MEENRTEQLYKSRVRCANALRLVKESIKLSDGQKQEMLGYADALFDSEHEPSTVTNKIERLRVLLEKKLTKDTFKQHNEATLRQLKAAIRAHRFTVIRNIGTRKNKRLVKEEREASKSTKDRYLLSLRDIYRWLKRDDLACQITLKRGRSHNRLPEEILDEHDIIKLINAAYTLRDKALIAVLWDSGMRIGELMSVRLKHMKFNGDEAIITAPEGKTGARRVLVIPSVPYLANWCENHPKKPDSNAYLFITIDPRQEGRNGFLQPMSYTPIILLLRAIAKRAGVTKAVNPHAFRHAAATRDATHLKEPQMREKYGWTKDSNMPAVYVHLSGRDTDDAIRAQYGKETQSDKNNGFLLKSVQCQSCQRVNPKENKVCTLCGRPLNMEKMISTKVFKRELTELFENPKLLMALKDKLESIDLHKSLD